MTRKRFIIERSLRDRLCIFDTFTGFFYYKPGPPSVTKDEWWVKENVRSLNRWTPTSGSLADVTPNEQRAGYAADALASSPHYDADDSSGVQDLLSDLMHLCRVRGYDFDDLLRVAADNFNAEVVDPEFEGGAA
jgi:hypothetical protein